MSDVRDLRASVEMTQSELADRAGTSQPTIAAYEAGRKSPTLRTLNRLATSVGRDVVISFVPSLTREARRSLFLHHAIVDKLRRSPEEALRRARVNLRRMSVQHPDAGVLIEEWNRILDRPIDGIVDVMIDPREHARELRHMTPFAGVLTAAERAHVYREFAGSEERR
ncbi:MAG TPA: helix-turn-helix domain-containing protein [Actinobacteria bacterium]|nr:helix-turn-helix domain-containing protein [Actinomycetota bacterium]